MSEPETYPSFNIDKLKKVFESMEPKYDYEFNIDKKDEKHEISKFMVIF